MAHNLPLEDLHKKARKPLFPGLSPFISFGFAVHGRTKEKVDFLARICQCQTLTLSMDQEYDKRQTASAPGSREQVTHVYGTSQRRHEESLANQEAIREKGQRLLQDCNAAREFARSLGLTVREA